jgi:hypothetical protein
VITAVPEPSTLVLLAAAGGLAVLARGLARKNQFRGQEDVPA